MSKTVFTCPICGANFNNQSDFMSHVKTHDAPQTRTQTRQRPRSRVSAYKKRNTIVLKAMPFMITCNPYQDFYLFSMKRMVGRDPNDPSKGEWDQLTMRVDLETLKEFGRLLTEESP